MDYEKEILHVVLKIQKVSPSIARKLKIFSIDHSHIHVMAKADPKNVHLSVCPFRTFDYIIKRGELNV